ncbi:uncharacterized protein LOC106162830 [Lingula anatina]|uniref:Uncharacterized protein LOC106162830 n=1 Tax=Lingula anatina TaxID=7574 RepID=A0A1S3IBU3_LINAN|nr:uncharacterized protein LOC106162830 [Lingula anatina]|eukprot:XP_013395712.1 uncharacterized protein LOC106162830 [Lingula anatina]
MLMNFDFVEHRLIYGLTFENCKQRCASDRQCGAGVYFITGMVCSMGLAGVQSTYTDVGVITIIKSSECNCEMEKHTGMTLYVHGSYPPGVNKWSFPASKPDDCPEACLAEPLCLLTQFNPIDKKCHSYNTWPFIGFGTAEENFYVKSRGC